MLKGIIDCGTNTFHLLIADVKADKSFDIVFKLNLAVKLGEGGIDKDIIKPVAYYRGLNALKEFKHKLTENNVRNVKCYGTAALRKATNGNDFLNDAKQLGITIELIDGEKEAALIHKGVSCAVNLSAEPAIIMDIGGGSTEFIICQGEKILFKRSFELGAALLLEKFKPHDPIKVNEIKLIEQYIYSTLEPMFEFVSANDILLTELVGSAGSFETFAEMCLHVFGNPNDLAGKNSFDIPLQQYHQIHKQLLASNAEQRKQMKGLIEMRVDMIVIASLLFMFVVRKLNINKVTLSAYALKEGMLLEGD